LSPPPNTYQTKPLLHCFNLVFFASDSYLINSKKGSYG